ncbi:PRTRC system protein C [Polaromonas aquatica]|uniref:PRTRC system protein C n=1 Tax=Polaromonas aquatica TaxID=332657 RepID=A0ABW1TV36_9BURK
MKEITISRVFIYNGIKLADPNPALQPDAVREFYVPHYQELNTAVVEGPVTKDNVATYTLRRAAGAKGRGPLPSPLRTRLQAIARGEVQEGKQKPMDAGLIGSMGGVYVRLSEIAKSKKFGRPLHMPREAFGFWG